MKTVLLTAVGSASANAARLSLQAQGLRVLGCDIYPGEWHVITPELDGFWTVPQATDAQAYADALLTLVQTQRIDAVVPLTDVEVDALCGLKARFRDAGAVLCCPEPEAAALCRDKLRMAQALAAAGIARPIPTYTADTLPTDLPFPLMLKPRRGRSSQAQQVVRTGGELALALSQRADYILQPYLEGDVYTVDAARDAAGHTVTLTRRELLRTANGLGTTVETCPAHPLDAVCQDILAFAGIIGVVNMEFIRQGNGYAFLEVNPRFSGGVGFSVLAGYDFPWAMLRCHAGEPLLSSPVVARMTLAQRYEMRITQP